MFVIGCRFGAGWIVVRAAAESHEPIAPAASANVAGWISMTMSSRLFIATFS